MSPILTTRTFALAAALAVAAGAGTAAGSRTARPAERAEVVRTLAPQFGDPVACFRLDPIRVSTVDARYAIFSLSAASGRYRSSRGCLVGDGYVILRRGAGGRWARVLDGSWDAAPCRRIGARVARDLTGLPCG